MTHQPKINYHALIFYTIKERSFYLITGVVVTLFFFLFIGIQLYKSGYFKKINTEKITKINSSLKIPEGAKIYKIKKGDYLWKIAEDQYGSGYNAYDIANANELIDPNNLVEGEKIIIPKLSPKAGTTGQISSINTSQVSFKGEKYIVQEGDYLWLIALKVYGDGYAAERIIKANNIPDINILEPGTILKIPR